MNLSSLVFRLLLGRRLPITQGSLPVAGLHATVRIHRDQYGIPLIEANDDYDGAYAVGFCHGQDRSFQLEFLQRVGQGTLAELVGPAALPVDRLSRRVGFHHAATRQWPTLHSDVRELLEAYALGVNAGRSLGSPHRPHELALLGGGPTLWTPIDTLVIAKLLSFTLCANWDAELARLKVLSVDGPESLRALDPSYPAWNPVIAPVGQAAGAAIDRLAEDLAAFFKMVGPGGGSNNWAISGSRTATGRPILANDPHLDASLPAHWYLASIRTPNTATAGATFIGGPTVMVGHNGTACWGMTAGLVDNSDLFLEWIGPDGASVRQGADFVPCEVREEVIRVKGTAAVTERVLMTARGPIVTPALGDPELLARLQNWPLAGLGKTSVGLSLRAVWLDALPVAGLFRIAHVKTFQEFRAAFEHWPVAAQNMVYADTSGTIGWQLIGRAPIRKKGHGALPLPGWDSEAGWLPEGVPLEEMPFLENPECGYLATANNRPQPEVSGESRSSGPASGARSAGQGPFLGVDFTDGYRVIAILEALASRRDHDVASTMRLQMDQRAPAWAEMREVVLAVPPRDDQSRQALDLLRGWDGQVSADSPAAAVYELFLTEMIVRLAKAKAPNSWQWVVGAGLSPITPYNFGCYRRTGHMVQLLREQPAGWFARPWPDEVAAVLGEVVGVLQVRAGRDPQRWGWGKIRPLVMHHPLGRVGGRLGRALGKIFNLGPIPCGGDADVINQGAVLPLMPLAPADNIPSLRAVFDVGAWHNSRFVLPGGQSGNPLSPHYADQFHLWQRGEGVPIAFTAEEMRQAAVQTLELGRTK